MTGSRLLLTVLLVSVAAVVHSSKVETESDAMVYLGKYGYMKSQSASDEERTKAICDFQYMANLNQTCILDEPTMDMMNVPRCGMPDNIGHIMDAKRKKRYSLGPRWSRTDLTYRIDNVTPDLNENDVYSTMAAAFKVWSDVTPLRFTRVSPRTPADIIIFFAHGEHGDGAGNAFDGPSNVLAHASFPENGDAHFDEGELWTLRTSRGVNLLQVAAHEFGHSLGLGHSEINQALMAPFYPGYNPNFQLHSDDIAAIRAHYGANSGGPDVTMAPNPVPPSIPCTGRVDAVVTSLDGSTYIFEGSYVWKFESGSSRISQGFPRPIQSTFPGLPNDIDAGFHDVREASSRKTYFFKGNLNWRYTGQVLDAGYPRSIQLDWRGLPGDLDAAFVWSGNGILYFVKGTQYYRFNGGIPRNYPRSNQVWRIPGNQITAAVQWINRVTYFFTPDGNYYRFNDTSFGVLPGYPRSVATIWQGCTNLMDGQLNPTTDSGVNGLVPSLLAVVVALLVGVFHL